MLILRGFVVWLLIILIEIIHGIVRGIFLVPLAGDIRSRQIGVLTGSLLILAVAFIFSNWLGAKTVLQRLGVGFLWVLLTLIFEITFGVFVVGADKARILEDYDLPNGGLMPIGLVFMLFTPMIASWLRAKFRSVS
jgi:hypothetical protein